MSANLEAVIQGSDINNLLTRLATQADTTHAPLTDAFREHLSREVKEIVDTVDRGKPAQIPEDMIHATQDVQGKINSLMFYLIEETIRFGRTESSRRK